MNQNPIIVLTFALSFSPLVSDQSKAAESDVVSPQVLPGKGLAQHDFLYAGESKQRRAFIVRKGQVVWSYDDPAGRGEISDAVLLSNGNLLLAHQFAVKLISPEKKVLWNVDAPKGTEIHTAMPIGNEHVLYVQNGDPALVKVVNIKTGETKKEFQVPVGNPKGVHGQFRHGRITDRGTLLLAHMDAKKVCEYDANGKEVRSFPAPNPWGVTPLKNGNFLVVDRPSIRELTLRGETVATLTPSTDSPDYKMPSLQMAWRLPNGNTLVNNWFNEWSGKLDRTSPPVQAVEFAPDKKIVWVLRSWESPDLGPATTIQILDEPSAPEQVSFGDIK
ncbi:MAG: PQQ-like beta-propeller repeat protein [Verrucomicrobia bacterium]|nr:PQQ-like beta-propeller repeat protein [Verrucomicrobiota bacterium]